MNQPADNSNRLDKDEQVTNDLLANKSGPSASQNFNAPQKPPGQVAPVDETVRAAIAPTIREMSGNAAVHNPPVAQIAHTTQNTFAIGSIIKDKYQILDELGKGGMGVVYKVRQIVVGKEMALKRLRAHGEALVTGDEIRRFQREAKACFKLEHKNIVKVFDFDPNDGDPFLIMEFVGGMPLSSLIRSKVRLPIDLTIEIAMQICDGLAHAHEQSILHRDLKPQNIMIQEAAQTMDLFGNDQPPIVKVLDFGLAKIVDTVDGTGRSLTKTGEAFGTPLYMSPEQCHGQQLDQRSDIYSLGCVIYECLTSHPPFVYDKPFATLLAHINDTPPSLTQASQAVDFPQDIERFVARMLEKNAGRRHKTMAEVKQDLINLRDGKSLIPATVAEQHKQNRSRQQLKKSVIIAVGCIALLIIATLSIMILAGGIGPIAKLWQVPGNSNGSNTKTTSSPVPSVDVESLNGRATPDPRSKTDQSLKVEVDAHLVADPLKLAGQDLTDDGLQYLARYRNVLNSIDISGTDITDDGITYLSRLRNLKMLSLNRTRISDNGIRYLTSQKQYPAKAFNQKPLMVLMLEHDKISNESMSYFKNLPALQVLDLNSTFVTDDGIPVLVRSAPGLKELDLSNNKVSDAGVGDCAKLKWLMVLDVSRTKITDSGLLRLMSNQQIRTLNLNDTAVTDDGLIRFLKSANMVGNLYLKNDQISDRAISAISKVPDLCFLDLGHTRITDQGLLQLAGNKNLKEIAVDGSRVTAGGIARFQMLNKEAQVVSDVQPVHYLIPIDGSYQYNLF